MSGQGFQVGGSFGGQFGGAINGGGNSGGDGGKDYIKDITTQTFMTDVIEASQKQTVLVDFWAPWCGPCKQLTPVLEKVVRDAKGHVILAKMNIEDHPEVAGQMGVQSIPAVIAFKGGQPVDAFMGVQPESQIKAFIEKVAGPVGPSDQEKFLEEANAALEAKDYPTAAQLYGAVLSIEAENAAAIAGLSQCYLGLGDAERAAQTLEMAPANKQNDPAMLAAKAALELAAQSAAVGDLTSLQNSVDQNPADFTARFDLAVALATRGDKSAAIDHLIEIIRQDREWNDSAARKQLLQFFDAWGAKDPVTNYGRRKLSAVLFS